MEQIKIDILAKMEKPSRRKTRFSYQESYGQGVKWLGLIPLPLGLGLVFGTGLSGKVSLRAWEWARYDYADHNPANAPRWASRILNEQPQPTTRTGHTLEAWRASR